MRRKINTQTHQRFVMYITSELRQEIEEWVKKKGITLAEFGREAFESYLQNKRREERQAQLAETCRIFDDNNHQIVHEYTATTTEQ